MERETKGGRGREIWREPREREKERGKKRGRKGQKKEWIKIKKKEGERERERGRGGNLLAAAGTGWHGLLAQMTPLPPSLPPFAASLFLFHSSLTCFSSPSMLLRPTIVPPSSPFDLDHVVLFFSSHASFFSGPPLLLSHHLTLLSSLPIPLSPLLPFIPPSVTQWWIKIR